MSESLSPAFLIVLERLSPLERAVLLLRQAPGAGVASRFMAAVSGGGGGKVQAATRPIEGCDRVARYYFGLTTRLVSAVSRLTQVGGSPSIVTYVEGRPIAVTSFSMADDQIQEIFVPTNWRSFPHFLNLTQMQ